jgi:NTP pyrophosphatase (non-canonical NTP hydrolase)
MSLEDLQKLVVNFRDARNWKQFHNPKDMALSLVLEANELLELTQWKEAAEIDKLFEDKKELLSDELADVLYWVLLIANDYKVDLNSALQEKLRKNELKYPLELAKDRKEKYSEF